MSISIKKIFGSAALFLFGCLFFFAQPLMASPQVSMSDNTGEETIPLSIALTPGLTPAQQVTISIFLDNDQSSVDSFQFNLTYNTSAITFASKAVGKAKVTVAGATIDTCSQDPNQPQSPGCNLLFNTNVPGTIGVGYYSNNALPTGSLGQIVAITFTVNSNLTGGPYSLAITGALYNETSMNVANSGTMTVSASSTAPVWDLSSVIPQITAGQSLTLNLPAATPAQNGDTLTYSSSTLPSWIAFTPSSREVDLTPSSIQAAGTTNVTFTVTDTTNQTSTSPTVTITVNTGRIPGDVLGHGTVDHGDVMAVQQAWAQYSTKGTVSVPGFIMANALVNGGSTFQYGDVIMIKQYQAGVAGVTLR